MAKILNKKNDIDIHTLEKVNLHEILTVFNESFSDYFVPIKISLEQLQTKITSENIQMEISVGAFINNKLVGFILHGKRIINGEVTIYNAGTGVVPERRGNKICYKLHNYIIPKLKETGATKIILEVIHSNIKAIKLYETIGFRILRELNCYKGQINSKYLNIEATIKKIELNTFKNITTFWDWEPTWQNSIKSMINLTNKTECLGIFNNEILCGYIIINPETKRIHQFAINKQYRNLGYGRLLFESINQIAKREVSIINVDHRSTETNIFLSSLGLLIYIKQFEMELNLA